MGGTRFNYERDPKILTAGDVLTLVQPGAVPMVAPASGVRQLLFSFPASNGTWTRNYLVVATGQYETTINAQWSNALGYWLQDNGAQPSVCTYINCANGQTRLQTKPALGGSGFYDYQWNPMFTFDTDLYSNTAIPQIPFVLHTGAGTVNETLYFPVQLPWKFSSPPSSISWTIQTNGNFNAGSLFADVVSNKYIFFSARVVAAGHATLIGTVSVGL